MHAVQRNQDRVVRCAIYTRKSTTAGLELEVNSLQAQREVCQAYIKCYAHKNWSELPVRYDDGGQSGGTLERPALKRLIADVEAGRVDIIIIYKIDRLTRSLLDFVRLIDVLGRYGASFVSVTQSFDTSDSMGRLVLNVLLTFAQFERELMGDRVRDKKAAMKRKGIFAGGLPPMGYLVKAGRLTVDPGKATIVREIFERYPHETVNDLGRDLRARGCTTRLFVSRQGNTRGGKLITNSDIGKILRNPVYAGYLIHRGEWIVAAHEALVTRGQWDLAAEVRRQRLPPMHDPNRNLLLGLLHDEAGRQMKILTGSAQSRNSNRYYASRYVRATGKREPRRLIVQADRVEEVALAALTAFLADSASVRPAVLALGLYSAEIARLLRGGGKAAARLSLMDSTARRHLFQALVPMLEATPSELRLYISCSELSRFLAWDGLGVFDREAAAAEAGRDKVHLLHVSAMLAPSDTKFPRIEACGDRCSKPDRSLTALVERAQRVRAIMLRDRNKSAADLAKQEGVGKAFFARLIRINYLAPDILAAIMDGSQPAGLTAHKILSGAMPLDWCQQRELLGFGHSLGVVRREV